MVSGERSNWCQEVHLVSGEGSKLASGVGSFGVR